MKDDKKLELLLERFYQRYNKYNTKVLEKLGEAIKKFDGVSPSTAHKIAQQLKYGTDINDLMAELSKLSGKSIKDIEEAFDLVAEENVAFSEVYAKAKNMEFVDYKDNEQLQRLVKGIAGETNATFKNISRAKTIGFVLKDADGNKIFKDLKKTYNDLIDEAVFNVTTGTTDYQSAMRGVMKQLADSGVKIHEEKVGYKSGYNIRIDSAVRQNVLTGIRQVNLEVQKQVGREYGADGIEISAHSPCAEDHLPIQGKQYSNAEFKKLNASLERPIGEYNCRHFVFSIVLGVNQPSYSNKTLNQMNRESQSIIKYEGKKYTAYEATQVQRKLETAIRKEKDRQIIARASGDKDGVSIAQKNITTLTYKYNDFSKNAGLDTYKNRLSVSGYRRVSVAKMK
jgi:hypothetical protein